MVQMTQKWKDLIQAGDRTFNVSQWLARSTLDAMGVGEYNRSVRLASHSYIGPQQHSTISLTQWRALRTPFAGR